MKVFWEFFHKKFQKLRLLGVNPRKLYEYTNDPKFCSSSGDPQVN
jgi:hypothetical protein